MKVDTIARLSLYCGLTFLVCTVSTAAAEIRIGVFNDLNGSVGSDVYYGGTTSSLRKLLEMNPDIIVAPGDLVGGEDFSKKLGDADFLRMWTSFGNKLHSSMKAKNIPFAPAPGNHDANAGLSREVKHYANYFRRAENKPAVDFVDEAHFPYFYSYIHKGVFFVALDSTLSGAIKSSQGSADVQKEWLRAQLASSRAVTAIARIVYAHVPLYSVLDKSRHAGKFAEVLGREQIASGREKSLESILVTGRVDLAIFGHSHVFYPGLLRYKENASVLHVLFAPRGGPGGRYLPGASQMSPQGFALIRVLDDGQIVYEARTSAGERMSCEVLPKAIASNGGRMIERDDEYCE